MVSLGFCCPPVLFPLLGRSVRVRQQTPATVASWGLGSQPKPSLATVKGGNPTSSPPTNWQFLTAGMVYITINSNTPRSRLLPWQLPRSIQKGGVPRCYEETRLKIAPSTLTTEQLLLKVSAEVAQHAVTLLGDASKEAFKTMNVTQKCLRKYSTYYEQIQKIAVWWWCAVAKPTKGMHSNIAKGVKAHSLLSKLAHGCRNEKKSVNASQEWRGWRKGWYQQAWQLTRSYQFNPFSGVIWKCQWGTSQTSQTQK